MHPLRLLFEILPVIFAIIAIPVFAAGAVKGAERAHYALVAFMCMLFVILQTGWIEAVLRNSSRYEFVFGVSRNIAALVAVVGIVLLKRPRK